MAIQDLIKWFIVLSLAILVRLLCFKSSLHNIFLNRIEISTPVNAWKRVTEGVYLQNSNVSPYSGDTFHEVPLALWLYTKIYKYIPTQLPILFTTCDLLTSLLLAWSASIYSENLLKKESKLKVPSSAKNLSISSNGIRNVPFYVFCIYLFSPYSIFSCVGLSTTTLANFVMSLVFAFISSRCWLLAGLALSVSSYHSIYPIVLLVPLFVAIINDQKTGKAKCVLALLTISLAVSGLLYLSKEYTGNWEFLKSTYGSVLTVPDLTPNVGLFWYFFTEMFDQFRVLFLWTFQINVFIYALPLAIRFKHEPMLLLYVQLFLVAVFKSYPSIGDYAIPLAFLPVWRHNFPFMRQSFLVGCILAVTFVLAPLLWYLWIYAGSANSNFYFGITLAFNTAQIFLVTDLLFAYCKRDYHLAKGVQLDDAGQPLRLDLK